MKILQLCNKIPYPPLDGGSIVINNTTQSLLGLGCVVHVLAIDTPKRPIAAAEISEEYRTKTHLKTVRIDTRLKVWSAGLNLFSSLPYHVSRYQSKIFEKVLIDVLEREKFDIIQVESLYLMLYVPLMRKQSKAKIVLRSQNVEYSIWEKYEQNLTFSPKKLYLKLQTKRLKAFEKKSCLQADGIVAITETDRKILEAFSGQKPLISIPLGVDLERFEKPDFSKTPPPSFFHLGSMDWYPNLEAVEWFLEKVWPLVVAKNPSIRLHLAGKHMPKAFFSYNSTTIEVLGKIENPMEYMVDKDVMLVPLLSGSGIRVKILEGMAMGKIVLSTTIGADGIRCWPDEEIIIADGAEKFAETLLDYVENPQKYVHIRENARYLIETQYDQKVLAKRFLNFYKKLLHADTTP